MKWDELIQCIQMVKSEPRVSTETLLYMSLYTKRNSYSLGGPATLQPSILPTLVKKASVPSPRHADVPVMALWAADRWGSDRRSSSDTIWPNTNSSSLFKPLYQTHSVQRYSKHFSVVFIPALFIPSGTWQILVNNTKDLIPGISRKNLPHQIWRRLLGWREGSIPSWYSLLAPRKIPEAHPPIK